MSTTLRLSDIIGRGVAVEWFEAVALVREVADRVRDSVGGRGVPELDQVQLSADGGVSITGAARTDEPVRRLGQLLQACLVQSEPPVQLRLAAAQATAPEPAYPSIREYSEALAYFERPDRPAVLRALHARAQSTPAPSAHVAPTLDAIAPLRAPEPQPRRTAGTDPMRARTSRKAVAAIAAVVAVVAAATVYSQLDSTAPVRAEVSTLAVKASDAVGTTLVKGISAVSETVGLGRLAPAGGSGAPAPAAAPVPAPAARPAQARKPSTKPGPAAPLRIFDLQTMPVLTGMPTTVATGEPVPDIPEPTPLVGTEALEETVYSAEDSTVTAPIGVRPQLPRVLPDDIRYEQLSQIELVVLPDGTVGSVKLLGNRRSVIEGMLLSAAKAWKFKPAEKDGRPVAYRKTVWLVLE